ncbi:MAG: TIGR02301 family protein [Hyphomicrobiaceae bacterium]
MSKSKSTIACRSKLAVAVLALCVGLSAPLAAAPAGKDLKPYDDRLMRLAEILGAVHFLRELCGANEGQYWRERMEELMRAEGSSALRQARLTRGFNLGYRNYARTYSTCTPTAQTAISRFLNEGAQISDGLVKSIP